jgi:hypothetical protein
MGNIDAIRGYVKTHIALMVSVVAKKGTLLGAKSMFVGVIKLQVGPAGATKSTEEGIGQLGVK